MKLIRKRFYPEEEIDISSDDIIYMDKEMLVTKWAPIKKRDDIKKGMSCVYLNKGIKISRVFDHSDNLVYTYCDIIRTRIEDDTLITEDLLVDVVIYPNGQYRVLDIDELVMLRNQGRISEDIVLEALEKLSFLLNNIYNGFSLDRLDEFLKESEY